MSQLNASGAQGSQCSEAARRLMPSSKAVVFLENHDTQRSDEIGYRDGQLYRLANAWMLAQPYGYPSIMSSYAFDRVSQAGRDRGPPSDATGATNDVTCASTLETATIGQWVCEHRDPFILPMVRFRRAVAGTEVSLLSVYLIHDQYLLLLTMVGVGIGWASILSMPYAILSTALPPGRMGVYMGVFNFFIVIPEIISALAFGPVSRALFGQGNPNAPLYFVLLRGVCLLVAAACVGLVEDRGAREVPARAVMAADESERLLVQGSVQPVPSSGITGLE